MRYWSRSVSYTHLDGYIRRANYYVTKGQEDQSWFDKAVADFNKALKVAQKKDETISFSCFPANVHFINIQFYGFIPNLFLLLLCIPYYIRNIK